MKLTILGTGNATVTECYNTCFVISDDDRHFMVDGGGGNTILHQLKAAGLNWMDMRDIFVTHKHIDHLLGIIWMMRMILQNMNRGKYEGEATIYGHEEVIRILKEMRNSVNRKVNCETANINKTVNAAVKQIEDIRLLEEKVGLESLNEGLEEIARLRLQYPEATLKELGLMLNPQVGKSGVNHRLRKLSLLADDLRENKEELL